jgi:excisionase family DNA binding protein
MREHLTTEQAAEYLGVSESWLAGSRVRGDGPPFYKLGRAVRYIRATLDDWTREREVRSNVEERSKLGHVGRMNSRWPLRRFR